MPLQLVCLTSSEGRVQTHAGTFSFEQAAAHVRPAAHVGPGQLEACRDMQHGPL